MALSLELLPSTEVDAGVRRLWAVLDEAGLPSLAQHTSPTNRPHLTLAVVDALPDSARCQVARLLTALPLAVTLESLAFFPRSAPVLYWAVTPSPELVRLHADLIDLLDSWSSSPAPLYRPGSWTPHCTLAMRLRPDQLGAALAALAGWTSCSGFWVGARTYDSQRREVTPLRTL